MKTLEQIKKQILDKSSLMNQLRIEIGNLKNEAVKLAPYQIGDRVLVNDGRGDVEVYVSKIEYVNDWRGLFDYSYSKPKKDGTMGLQGAGIYFRQPIRKIETNNNPPLRNDKRFKK